MKNLLDYIVSQERRLVSPVGGGSTARFSVLVNTENMATEERMANWMAFQTGEYGHDFPSSTMLDVYVCKCLGLQTFMLPGGSEHVITGQVKNRADLHKLRIPSPLSHPLSSRYINCIREFRKLSPKPVGGACFGPFTVAGGILGTQQLCMNCIDNPRLLHEVLQIATSFILQMALDCEKYGADFFWIAEPSAVLISPRDFWEFSGQYIKQIFDNIAAAGFLHVPGDTTHLIEGFVQSGAQCLSLDSFVDMRDTLYRIPSHVSILGNINSLSMLYNPVETVAAQVEELLQAINNFPNFIISSGGGLSPDTPEKNIRVLFEAAKTHHFWNNDQFTRINSLWRMMAGKSYAEIRGELLTGRFSPEVIRSSFEEACTYLGRQYKKRNISLEEYTRQLREISLLLHSDYINTQGTVSIDDHIYKVEQLQRNFFNLMHSQFSLYS